jgi:hypothetical protein
MFLGLSALLLGSLCAALADEGEARARGKEKASVKKEAFG